MSLLVYNILSSPASVRTADAIVTTSFIALAPHLVIGETCSKPDIDRGRTSVNILPRSPPPPPRPFGINMASATVVEKRLRFVVK